MKGNEMASNPKSRQAKPNSSRQAFPREEAVRVHDRQSPTLSELIHNGDIEDVTSEGSGVAFIGGFPTQDYEN